LSEGPESSDIDSEQVWSVPMLLIIHILTVTICVLWWIAEAFGV